MVFWKKQEKWHDVRWSHGTRRIYLALQFAKSGGPATPKVEHLPSLEPERVGDAGRTGDTPEPPARVNGNGKIADALIVSEVQAALDEYNRKNLLTLRVAAIRYRAQDISDHADLRAAATKLLNLLWKAET